MKSMTRWTGAVLLAGAAALVGCEDRSAPTSAAPAGGPQQATHDAAAKATEKAGEAKSQAAASVDSAQAALIEKAKPLIEQAQKYIKENNLDSAAGVIAKLEEMKPKLPEAMRGQIDNLKGLLEKAKSAGSALKNVPGVGH